MKRIFTLLVLTFLLTGCATVKGWVQPIAEKLRWFEMYSESKGWQQADVLRLTAPMKESVADFVKRSEEKQGSETYCEIKKKMLQTQAATAAKAVLGRF